MSNSEKIQQLIKTLSGQDAFVIGVPIELIHFLGDPGKALLLSQLIYWSDKGIRRDKLIFKSYEEMEQETGIKPKTCSRYYAEFKEMGFFDWRQKPAMGKNVIHFRVDMDKLSECIRTFWEARNGQIVQSESDKMSNSITENTAKITSIDNTLSTTNIGDDSEEENSTVSVNAVKSNLAALLLAAGFSKEAAVPLPSNFEPSLDNQFWAVSSFPEKSPGLATESFIDYYSNKPGVTKTATDWQSAWRKWMKQERVPYGYSDQKLSVEQETTTEKVRNIIHLFALENRSSILHREVFYSMFDEGELKFSKETIDACLDELIVNRNMSVLFGNYIFTSSRRKGFDGQWHLKPGQIFDDWNVIDESLANFISKRSGTTREEISQKFPGYCQKSINAYLQSGVDSRGLAMEGDKYWDAEEYPEWRVDVGFGLNSEELLAA